MAGANTINDATTQYGCTESALGRIDQYELHRELGGGGFGTVYLARDMVAGIDVAVKGLPPIIRNNEEELEHIRENFALVSLLHHPYIAAALHLQLARDVRYRDETVRQKLRVEQGDTLMVMEYAPGVTLSKWRRQFPGGKVPLEPALQLVWQVAQALDYAHEQHILHRDVKPSNIMVETRPDGEVVARLLDFGLAAEIRSSMGRVSREIHDTSGTRPYMAPEQWEGRKQGPATDQYSLAVLLCELLTGEVPFASAFETGDPVVMMLAVCKREVELPADCPRKMALRRALAKSPSQRFANCMEFVETAAKGELDTLRGGYVAGPQDRSRQVLHEPSRMAIQPRRTIPSRVLPAAILVLLLAIVGGMIFWHGQRQRRLDDARRQDMIAAAQKAAAERLAAKQKAEEDRRAQEAARQRAEEERKVKEEAARMRKAEEERLAAERTAKDAATEIRIEAKVQQGKVARISDADGFKARKDALEDVFIRAEAFYDENARRWAEAGALYRDYIAQSKSVITLDDERQQAVANRSAAQASFTNAEADGAKTYAASNWNGAVKVWQRGVGEFSRNDFSAAKSSFGEAARLFSGCGRISTAERSRQERLAEEKRERERLNERKRQAEELERVAERNRKIAQYSAVKVGALVQIATEANAPGHLGVVVANGNGAIEISIGVGASATVLRYPYADITNLIVRGNVDENAIMRENLLGRWIGTTKYGTSGADIDMSYDFMFDADGTAHMKDVMSFPSRRENTYSGKWNVSGNGKVLSIHVASGPDTGKTHVYNLIKRSGDSIEFRLDLDNLKRNGSNRNFSNVRHWYDASGIYHFEGDMKSGWSTYHVVNTETPRIMRRVR